MNKLMQEVIYFYSYATLAMTLFNRKILRALVPPLDSLRSWFRINSTVWTLKRSHHVKGSNTALAEGFKQLMCSKRQT